MPIYNKDHYDREVESLEADLEACRLDIASAEQRVIDLKSDLTKKEAALRAAKFLRDHHF